MTRKIVQVTAVPPGSGYCAAVVALADDGTVWASGFNPEAQGFNPWQPLPHLAATDEEALRLVDQHKVKQIDTKDGFWKRLFNPFSLR